MSHSLELFHDILFLNHRPWKFGKQSDIKFKQLLLEVKKEYYTHQPKYEIDFIKPLSNIRKYYHAIIEYEAIAYLNDLHTEISAALSDNEKSYLIHVALSKLISQKLKETAQVIQERKYSPEQFDLKLQSKKVDTNIADESYILHLLKQHLVRLVMETQDSYQEFMKEDDLTPDEIYYTYFNEAAPERPYIIECEDIAVPIKKHETKTKPEFKPIYQDIKPILKSKADYEIVYKPRVFGEVESKLYEYGIIDIEYYFIKSRKQSNHTLLAAVYRILIANNYFRRNIIGSNAKFTDLDIRKYLDERYSTDTSQQFRRLTQKQVDESKIKLPWLDNISRIS